MYDQDEILFPILFDLKDAMKQPDDFSKIYRKCIDFCRAYETTSFQKMGKAFEPKDFDERLQTED